MRMSNREVHQKSPNNEIQTQFCPIGTQTSPISTYNSPIRTHISPIKSNISHIMHCETESASHCTPHSTETLHHFNAKSMQRINI